MKKLAAITVLGLALGFSSSSFAVNIVAAPDTREVATEITGGKIETSPMSFYFEPVQKGTGRRQTAKAADYDEPTLFVFGVRL